MMNNPILFSSLLLAGLLLACSPPPTSERPTPARTMAVVKLSPTPSQGGQAVAQAEFTAERTVINFGAPW